MRIGTTTAIILTFAALPAVAQTATALRSKPVVDINITPVVSGTLGDMYAAADHVVSVTVISREVRGVGDAANPRVTTFYTAKVLADRKGHVAKEIIFTHDAGELELGDRILRVTGQPPLSVGSRYIVFLRKNPRTGQLMLLGEREGAFKLHEGRVDPLGFSRVAEEQRNLPERKFGDELDRIARRSASKE